MIKIILYIIHKNALKLYCEGLKVKIVCYSCKPKIVNLKLKKLNASL